MFKGFSSVNRPKAVDELKAWQELLNQPSTTDKSPVEVAAAREKEQREQSRTLASSCRADNSRGNDHDENRAPIAPLTIDTGSDNGFSSASSSQRPTPRPRTSISASVADATTGLASLKTGFSGFGTVKKSPEAPLTNGFGVALKKPLESPAANSFSGFGFKSAVEAPAKPAETPSTSGFGTVKKSSEATPTSAFTGFLSKPAAPAASTTDSGVHSSPSDDSSGTRGFGAASGGFGAAPSGYAFGGSPPRAAATSDAFRDFGGKSAPPPVFENASTVAAEAAAAAAAQRPTEKPSPGSFGSGGPGVARMLAAAMADSVRIRSPSVSPPKPQPADSFTGFGADKKSPDAPPTSAFTGFGATKKEPQPTSAFSGFGAANKESPATNGFGVALKKPVEEPTKNTFSGFGFKSTLAAPAKPAETPSTSGFGTVKKSPEAPVTNGFGVALKKPAEEPTKNTFTGFGAGNKTTEAPATNGFGVALKKPMEEPTKNTFSGFGFKSTLAAPAKPAETPSTSGFGTIKNTPEATPTSAFTGFGAGKKSPEAPATNGFGVALKKPLESPAACSFTGFGFKSTVEAPAKTTETPSTSGFGTIKRSPEAPPTSAFTGFGAGNKATTSSGFGTIKTSPGSAPTTANGFTGFGGAVDKDRVQMDFGTLHVSGPQHVMRAIEENERRRSGEGEKKEVKEEPLHNGEKQGKQQRRVHFEGEEEEEKASTEAARQEERSVNVEEDEGEDDDTTTEQLYPWGKRPCFRKMLEGGSKKLVLTNPHSGVSDFYSDQVFRSYGCTYDPALNMFYATSPGARVSQNGQVMAMRGSCTGAHICVASGLAEPAAIAVYEPGLSVCVVTNRGIFVFTHQFDAEGEPTGQFLTRQISFKGGHRGICVTAGGGIVSFNNGKVRMFDGNVANGEERVLTETNYDYQINEALFTDNPIRRNERSSASFMDIVDNKLVMSDLQKHVISLWKITDKTSDAHANITFIRAADVAVSREARGKMGALRGPAIPLGKMAYASGIRLDAEGWVLCADADGRTIQIFDDALNFVTRVETTRDQLPYVSGLCIEARGHLMVCDRKSEMGGLRVYMLEAVAADGSEDKKPAPAPAAGPKKTYGFAAAAKLQSGAGGRF